MICRATRFHSERSEESEDLSLSLEMTTGGTQQNQADGALGGGEHLLTSDSLFNGDLTIFQEKEGYRFSLDAVLLAGLTRVRPEDRVADLGTGCAVVLLILAYRGLGGDLVGIEIQPELAAMARRNVEINHYADRIRVLDVDFRHVADHLAAGSFDLVMSNPPYRRLASGRINPNQQRAMARHELKASVADVFAAGKHLLLQGGTLAVVYPATRLDSLLVEAHHHGFSPKELTLIYSNPSRPASLVHLDCRKGGGEELRVQPPFFIYEEKGSYSESMGMLYKR
jgi:tRNA1Val (adenine37-N6)-methyltransferase